MAETELAAEGPGLPVTVTAVLPRGGVVRAECRAEDGRVFDADFLRAAPPSGLTEGATMWLRPRRVTVFAR